MTWGPAGTIPARMPTAVSTGDDMDVAHLASNVEAGKDDSSLLVDCGSCGGTLHSLAEEGREGTEYGASDTECCTLHSDAVDEAVDGTAYSESDAESGTGTCADNVVGSSSPTASTAASSRLHIPISRFTATSASLRVALTDYSSPIGARFPAAHSCTTVSLTPSPFSVIVHSCTRSPGCTRW